MDRRNAIEAERRELKDLIDFALEYQLIEGIAVADEWVTVKLEGEEVRMQIPQARAFLAAIVRAFEHSPSISWHGRRFSED